MKFILVAHGPPVDLDQPVSGGALRAQVHQTALEHAGHEVIVLRRRQDVADGYRSAGELRRMVQRSQPDAILCVAVEEAWALRGIAPLCVDLYAPRMLEAAWEGGQEEQADLALRAVHVADEVLYSNPRQRWFWLGILGLAGWDLSKPCGRVVPLAALGPVEKPKAGAPYFVMGGQRWPWQDPTETLGRAVEVLKGRAEVRVYGPPSGVPGVREMGTVSRREWLSACAGAVAVLDRYAPHHEREMALSFRQMDALAAGAPLISDADTPLANELRTSGAGWVDEPLEEAIEAALSAGAGVGRVGSGGEGGTTRGGRAAPASGTTRGGPGGGEPGTTRLGGASAGLGGGESGTTRVGGSSAGHGGGESGTTRLGRSGAGLGAYAPEQTSKELLAWVPRLRERGPSVVDAARGLATARARSAADRQARLGAEAEVVHKRAEVEALQGQVRALTSAVEATSAAISDVAAFRRETVSVLGARLSGVEATREQLAREVETLRADLQKKDAELAALIAERDRLLRVFRWRR